MTMPSGSDVVTGGEIVDQVLTAAQWADQMKLARDQLAAQIANDQAQLQAEYARIAASTAAAGMDAASRENVARIQTEAQERIAQLEAQIQREALALQKIDADRQFGLDVQRFGLETAAQNWLEKTTAVQFEMDKQQFGLNVAQFNAQQRQAQTQAKLQALELLASRSGPQDWVRYNNLLGGMSSPEALARGEVDPFAFIGEQFQEFTPGELPSLMGQAGQNTPGGFPGMPGSQPPPGGTPGTNTGAPGTSPPPGGSPTSPDSLVSGMFGNNWQGRFDYAQPGGGGTVAVPGTIEASGTGFGATQADADAVGYGGPRQAVSALHPNAALLNSPTAQDGGIRAYAPDANYATAPYPGPMMIDEPPVIKAPGAAPNTDGPPELFDLDTSGVNPNDPDFLGDTPTYTLDANGNYVLVPAMAHGGVTNANTLLVGERGPELLQRQGSLLRVIPLGQTATAATGGEFNLSTQYQTPQQLSTAGQNWAAQYGQQPAGSYGASNPYTFSFAQYSPETLGNQPFIQKIRGQRPANEFQQFGATINNPSLGIQNFPFGHQVNYRTLLNLNPSEQQQTQGLVGALGLDFNDWITASRRGAPAGTRFGVAGYSGR